ncbi:hypothetical protein NPIL_403971 [Nephila pilipes]|uniref:Uncharacterized protein n=1 Tax=Nephila pilipes TaxID=299642 RepID=A0A8X6Q7Z9_NEPPI|nr:hypothetical protein NPIL_403971 [Nephila pilipes]
MTRLRARMCPSPLKAVLGKTWQLSWEQASLFNGTDCGVIYFNIGFRRAFAPINLAIKLVHGCNGRVSRKRVVEVYRISIWNSHVHNFGARGQRSAYRWRCRLTFVIPFDAGWFLETDHFKLLVAERWQLQTGAPVRPMIICTLVTSSLYLLISLPSRGGEFLSVSVSQTRKVV